MAKVMDITEKLNFEENPKLRIKKQEIEVDASAATTLKVMQLLGNGNNVRPEDIVTMYELIFSESERKKIDKLGLKFDDFQILVESAITLITGEGEEGE